MTDDKDEQEIKSIEQFLFSPAARRSVAIVAGVPFALAAAHTPFGCSELEQRWASACDPVLYQRHGDHIETSTATGTGVPAIAWQTYVLPTSGSSLSSSGAVSIATFDQARWEGTDHD